MIHLSSFSYVKLFIGLALTSIGVFMESSLGYYIMGAGSLALITAFASFGNYNSIGNRGKKMWVILRYVLAGVLALVGILYLADQCQLYNSVVNMTEDTGEVTHYISGEEVGLDIISRSLITGAFGHIDAVCILIAYLLMYKPSPSSAGQKILKAFGYILIITGTFYLCGAYITYLVKASCITFIISICLLVAGTALSFFGRRTSKISLTSRD